MSGHGPLGAQVKLRPLARPPAPEELEALRIAVQVALGVPGAQDAGAASAPWRLGGRWWRPAPWDAPLRSI